MKPRIQFSRVIGMWLVTFPNDMWESRPTWGDAIDSVLRWIEDFRQGEGIAA